jgi:Tfp pilus assembly protein PilX
MRDERGWAVVTALMVISVMTMFALATLATVDQQSRSAGKSRVQETSYNVSEAAMDDQLFNLSQGRKWPGTAALAYPATCTRGSTADIAAGACPNATEMATSFVNTDFQPTTDWTVTIRDNLGSAATYYKRDVLDASSCPGPSGLLTPCTWDSNKDGKLWIRASSNVRNQQRTLVALVQQTQLPIPIPKNSVVAGKFSTTNQGNKVIVDTLGCAAAGTTPGVCKASDPGKVAVRCSQPGGPVKGGTCLGWDPAKGQVNPNAWQDSYPGNTSGCQTGIPKCALTKANLDDLRRHAQADGTYYASGCPTDLTGDVVFVENGNCSYTGGSWNTPTDPGALVINSGTLSLGGNITYYGLIYAANAQKSTGTVVSLGGAATVQGAIMIEGDGVLAAGSNNYNIIYDPDALDNVIGYSSTPSISQNTFRELPGSQ